MDEMKAIAALTIIIVAFMLFYVGIGMMPIQKNLEDNPFVVGEGLPLVAAHRGGGDNNPENTMLAFREAVNTYRVDIIESDLWLTKDGYLVYNHDGYIDRTCDVNGDISYEEMRALIKDESKRHYISDMTLAQLEEYNFGYYFENENGERIYKDEDAHAELGIGVATVEELFEEFYLTNPDLLFIVEIKDSGERGYEACKILNETLNNYPEYRDNIVVGSFHGEIEDHLTKEYPSLMRGASVKGAMTFILTYVFGVNVLDTSDFACLQIPMSYDLGIEIGLEMKGLIDIAHKRNVAVQYWTINEEADMRRLIELKCDCIMTDNPKLLRQVVDEYKVK